MKKFRIQEKSQIEKDLVFYLDVESNYHDSVAGHGRSDSVLFTMGQETPQEGGIDATIACSVDEARRFAEEILKTCNEIEGK